MRIPVPTVLAAGAGSTPAGQAWLAGLDALHDRAVERWGLTLGEPYGAGTAAWTAPGTTPDGTPVVLKLVFPHTEAAHEALALDAWRGSPASVELVDRHTEDWALLLRRAHPGTPLLTAGLPPDAALEAAWGVLSVLHRCPTPAGSAPRLTEVAAGWAQQATVRADRWAGHLVAHRDVVVRGLAELSARGHPDGAPEVLLHGDLNPGNILFDDPLGTGAGRWLAIDPKPMTGDPAYDVWPALSQIDPPLAHPDPVAVAGPRVARAAAVLGIPPQRICRWALARSVESALWVMDTWPDDPQRHGEAVRSLAEAAVWARLVELVPPRVVPAPTTPPAAH